MDITQTTAAQTLLPARTARKPDGPSPADDPAAVKAARDFEAMFLTQMVDEMLKQVDMGDFGGGAGQDQFRYFMAEAFGKQIAEQGGGGIAQSLQQVIGAYAASQEERAKS